MPTGGYDSTDFEPQTQVSAAVPSGCPALDTADPLTSSLDTGDVSSDQTAALGGASSPWDAIRILLQGIVAQTVPGVGDVLAAMIEIMWPGSENENVTWEQMQQYVEKAVGQAVDEKTKSDLEASLKGLDAVLHNYVVAIQAKQPWSDQDKSYIQATFVSALNALEHDAPSFQPANHPYLVLAEYTEMQNMLLGQLRDGILNGSKFGLPSGAIADYKTQIASRIADATAWVPKQLAAAHTALPSVDSGPLHNIKVYNQNAQLDLQLVPAVSDAAFYWPYLDPVKYPGPQKPVNKRILYTPSFGLIPNANLPSLSGDRAPIVHFTVWGYDRIDAFQLTYGLGSKPDPRMGDEQHCDYHNNCTGGTANPPHGGSFQAAVVSDGKGWITRVHGYSGDVPESLGFDFNKSGTLFDTGLMGSGRADNFSVQLPGEVVCYALIPGVAGPPYGSANGMIFGFRFADSY